MKYEVKLQHNKKETLNLQKNLDKLFELIVLLAEGEKLDIKYKDHDLSGHYKGTRECHIEPDWLLVYEYQMIYLYSCFIDWVHILNYLRNKNDNLKSVYSNHSKDRTLKEAERETSLFFI